MAQDKWSEHILKLDSLEESDKTYANLVVEIAWQISDLSPDSAIYYGELGLQLGEKYDRDTISCRALLGLSGAISRKGQNAEAITLSLKALKLAEQRGDTTAIFDAVNNIGIDYYYQNEMAKSLDYFNQCAAVIEHYRPNNQKSRHQYANALMNIALVEAELGNTKNEINTYHQVRDIFQEMGDLRSMALVDFNLGKTYYGLTQYDSAEFYFDQAIKIFRSKSWTSAECDVLTTWSELKFDKGEYESALTMTRKSLKISQDSNNDLQEKYVYELLHKIFAALHQYDSAYLYQNKYLKLLNESREKEKVEYADDLVAKYESDKKERQIASLEQEKTIAMLESERQRQLKLFLFIGTGLLAIAVVLLFARYRAKKKTSDLLDAKNQELAKLNNTKNRLFSIISHDLKSPLSSFHTITKSLSDNWEALEKDQLREFIITLRDSSKDVKNMMDNLLKWALAQTGGLKYVPKGVFSAAIIHQVKAQLESVSSLKKINIETQIEEVDMIQADQQFLEIVIRNLLSNAVKFSPMNSEIKIVVADQGETQAISIQDFGVGMDQTQIEQLLAGNIVAQDIQNSNEKGTGLGLSLCNELINKMGAKMNVVSEIGKGTIFNLVFPKAA